MAALLLPDADGTARRCHRLRRLPPRQPGLQPLVPERASGSPAVAWRQTPCPRGFPPPGTVPGRSTIPWADRAPGPERPVPCCSRRRERRQSGSSQCALPFRCTAVAPPRLGAFLDEPGLVDDEHALPCAELLDDIRAEIVSHRVGLPVFEHNTSAVWLLMHARYPTRGGSVLVTGRGNLQCRQSR